jgi:hypothetical protein
VFVIILIDIKVLKAVALFPASTDSVIMALLAGFPTMNKDETPIKNAKATRKTMFPEIIRATMDKIRQTLDTKITGFLPYRSAITPHAMSPPAVLRLRMLWTNPSSTMVTPRERM